VCMPGSNAKSGRVNFRDRAESVSSTPNRNRGPWVTRMRHNSPITGVLKTSAVAPRSPGATPRPCAASAPRIPSAVPTPTDGEPSTSLEQKRHHPAEQARRGRTPLRSPPYALRPATIGIPGQTARASTPSTNPVGRIAAGGGIYTVLAARDTIVTCERQRVGPRD